MPSQITLPIRGVSFPNAKGPSRRFAVELLAPGDPVELRPEPRNPTDPNAIAVYSTAGVQMGYLPAERAPYVGRNIGRGGVSAVFQGLTAAGAFVRIAFDGEAPILPEIKEAKEQGRDWWPDGEWPE